MAVEERRRIELFERLSASIGPEATATMFDLLPPPGDDHVTRADLRHLEGRIDERFEQVDERFAEVDRRFTSIDRRFDEVDHRFELVDQRFDEMDLKLDVLRNELLAAFRGELVTAVSGQTRAVIVATATATFGIGGLAVTLSQLL
jgi:hypothetical protein